MVCKSLICYQLNLLAGTRTPLFKEYTVKKNNLFSSKLLKAADIYICENDQGDPYSCLVSLANFTVSKQSEDFSSIFVNVMLDNKLKFTSCVPLTPETTNALTPNTRIIKTSAIYNSKCPSLIHKLSMNFIKKTLVYVCIYLVHVTRLLSQE